MPEFTFLSGAGDWWRQAVIYQVYPRSFADANGDGIGDLEGIISRVDYFAELGIDAVWLSPFYPSALADGGYDVDDYRDVDPKIGTLAQFDRMTEALHERGIRVIVDVVPNHSSNRHVWFQEALAAPAGSTARERYIFRVGRGENGELAPNDWPSHFGPTSWTRAPDGQWYLHLFAPEQPDFNWDNTEVRDDFLETFRFWSDRGVDGFRIDVAHALVKDMTEPFQEITGFEQANIPLDGSHPLFDRDEVHEIYASWRGVFDEYDPPRVAVAEAWVPSERRPRYASPDGLGQAFNFDLLLADWDQAQFRDIIAENLLLAAQSGSSSTWVLSNHDVIRHATRYGLPSGLSVDEVNAWLLADGGNIVENHELGLRRARAAVMLMLALPGATYLYQGEELGLFEVADLDAAALQDPQWMRSGFLRKGRDGCRVPLPWTRAGSSFGFGADGAHLPQPGWFGGCSVEAEKDDEGSTLSLYRRVLALRKELQGAEELDWVPMSDEARPDAVLAFRRPGGWVSATNFGLAPVDLPAGRILASSSPLVGGMLPGNTTVWLATD